MKSRIYRLFLITGIIAIAVLVFALKQFNRPLSDIQNTSPDIEITANQLVHDYQENEMKASDKYNNKIIQVTGIIKNFSTANGNMVINLESKDDSGVICEMIPQANKDSLKLKKGEKILIKGSCTGFLLDVVLVRCVIVN